MRSTLAIVNVLGALLAMFAGYYVLPVATALTVWTVCNRVRAGLKESR